jgi:hypothetical protein
LIGGLPLLIIIILSELAFGFWLDQHVAAPFDHSSST